MILWNVNTSPSNIGTAFWKSRVKTIRALLKCHFKFESIKKKYLSVFEEIHCGWQCPDHLHVSMWPLVAEILWPCTKDEPFLLRESRLLLRLLRSVCPVGWPLPAKPSIHVQNTTQITKNVSSLYNNPLFYYSFCALRVVFVSHTLTVNVFFLAGIREYYGE